MAIVTLTRGTFSEGVKLAECVAADMGYQCLSREEMLKDAAERYGVPEYGLAAALGNKPDFIESLNGVSLARKRYIAFAKAALARYARQGRLVYHGQAGHLLLKDVPGILRVRVIGDKAFRIEAAMSEYQLSRRKAIALIKKLDQDRTHWIQSIYNIDDENSFRYDMVVDLKRMSVVQACEMMVITMKAMPETSGQFRKALDDFALTVEATAQVAAHREISDTAIETIEVTADSGTITLRGKADSVADEERIMEVVALIPGVSEIVSHLEAQGKRTVHHV